MAVIITHKAEDQSSSMSDNKTTLERLLQVEGDSIMEITTSDKIPKYGSRHPANSLFVVSAVNVEPVGNIGRKVQAAVRITYTDSLGGSGGGGGGGGNKETDDPWKLGATNVSEDYITERAPLRFGYNERGEYFQLRNSAGSRLLLETDVIIRQISFNFAVKAKNTGEPPLNNRAIICSGTEKVAGYTFAPYQAMLMPMKASYVTDVDDDGDIYRRYWSISAIVLEHPRSWVRSALDVGTMAKFKIGDKMILAPIYQYTPWTSTKDSENIKTQPRWGSINDVVAAKLAYANKFSGSERSSRFDALPYNEITEPLPLDNGQVFTAAIEDPANNPYKTIRYFEYKPGSWSSLNLPQKRA